MEYHRTYMSEDGSVMELKIKTERSTPEEVQKTLRFMAQCARWFYLETAEKFNSLFGIVYPVNKSL